MEETFLLYDGECPACRSYVAMARLRQQWPALRVLDARHEPALTAELRAKGFEINDGMVLSLGGRIYFGAEATRMMATGGRQRHAARRAALWAIGAAPWSRQLYPWLNRGRQLLLRVLGRRLVP